MTIPIQYVSHEYPYELLHCTTYPFRSSDPSTVQVIELEGSSTLNLGVKALLMKCRKARRLALCFSRFGLTNVVITDEGMSYIGRYGGNLDIITLTNCGSSDVGLACLAAGCVKLRKLELRHCPFGDLSTPNAHSLAVSRFSSTF